MRVTVTGAGHVGLVHAAAMAVIGHQVTVIDCDVSRIKGLQEGVVPFHEPLLREEVVRQVNGKRLRFTLGARDAYGDAEVVFLCVGTPPRDDGSANLMAVENAARDIRKHAPRHCVVVEKSTVPTGTAERLLSALNYGRNDLHVASNPEFLREGTALRDTLNPDRIVVGTSTKLAADVLRDVYRPLIDSGSRYIETSVATAELSKHASNSMLAMRISYMNALAEVCDRTGADVERVAEIMGADPRIGPSFLKAGLGFGGFCFPKDVAALAHTFTQNGVSSALLDEVLDINERAVRSVFRKIESALWHVEGKNVVVFGVAFKPDTDDVRFSPALKLVEVLTESRAHVSVWDPAVDSVRVGDRDVFPHTDLYEAARNADVAVIATDWEQLHKLDFFSLSVEMSGREIIDARNFLSESEILAAEAAGFTVTGVGR